MCSIPAEQSSNVSERDRLNRSALIIETAEVSRAAPKGCDSDSLGASWAGV